MAKKLLLLTAEQNNWAPQELIKYAKKYDYEVEVIDPAECYISLSGDSYISYNGTKFLGASICIPRLSEENLDYKVSIINHLEEMGIKVLNTGSSLKTASNKIETQIKLNAVGIKTPKTALFTGDTQLEHAIKSIGGKFPVIVKTIFGTHGVGVIRADSEASLKSIVQQLLKSKTEFMLQEYLEHEESARILLLNGEPLAAVMRSKPKNDFRTNAHQNAELKKHDPSEKEIEIVKKAAEAIGINFAAVDYILIDDEVILLEVNGSPGFQHMQKVVDIDIADKVIKYCDSLVEESDKEAEETKEDLQTEIKEPIEEEDKVIDIDKEEAKEKDKEQEEEKHITPHHNIINPELLDNAHEHIIGTVTSVVIKHFNDDVGIEARVDTGANVSSIAGEDIKVDKESNTVKFKFNNVVYKFHLLRLAKIKQADSEKTNERPVIRVDMVINGLTLHNIELNVNTREHMKYSILIGRNTLAQAGVLINPAANNIDMVSAVVSTKEEE
jgi:ribosomal protein S6--L-glutamate ligase